MEAINASNARASAPLIMAHNLTRRFGSFVAVNGIDIRVHPGEVFGLLGANGAGKTTAIRMLCGTLRPSAGDVRISGIDMVLHARKARGRIGYVAQRFALYDELSVLENLQLQAGLYGLRGKRERLRLSWVLEHLDLTFDRSTIARELPLGYKRRLALGAALVHEPDVLFLDEPTSGVDPLARQRFWDLIYDLTETGIGALVTTHYMDEALFSDRLALMQAGVIVDEGTPEQLLQRKLETPILELHSARQQQWAQLLKGNSRILEIVPHAGRLRIRLQARSDTDQVIQQIYGIGRSESVSIERLGPAEPELEDVFVALLESSAQNMTSP